MALNREENIKIIKKLKESEWIDRATRLVSVEFALYNGNTDIFAEVKLAAEILPTGALFPFYTIEAFHVMRLSNARDYILLVIMVFFYLMILIYIVDFILQIANNDLRKSMWKSVWVYLDMIIIIMGLLSFILAIVLPIALKSYIENNEKNEKVYLGLDQLSVSHLVYSNITAMLIFAIWVKVFKYIGFNKTMLQFSTTLKRVNIMTSSFWNILEHSCISSSALRTF